MIDMNDDIPQPSNDNRVIILTLEKECYEIWPHLLTQQTDEEIENYLREANFLIHVHHNPSTTINDVFDTLDFETVINGQGEKTGLE
jgi:hypothetical protein